MKLGGNGDIPLRSMVRGEAAGGCWVHNAAWLSSGPQFCCPKQFESWMTSVIVPPPITGKLALRLMGKVSCTASVFGIELV